MPYWQAFYHIVWATKGRLRLIDEETEAALYPIIAAKCHQEGGHAFVVNGMPDHVHLVTTIPPKLSAASFVGFVKGAASYAIQSKFDIPFKWQRGYGLFTISRGNLQQAIRYVERQKEHHRDGTVIPAYERFDEKESGPIE